jgi:hypothetical protein
MVLVSVLLASGANLRRFAKWDWAWGGCSGSGASTFCLPLKLVCPDKFPPCFAMAFCPTEARRAVVVRIAPLRLCWKSRATRTLYFLDPLGRAGRELVRTVRWCRARKVSRRRKRNASFAASTRSFGKACSRILMFGVESPQLTGRRAEVRPAKPKFVRPK